MTVCLCVSLCDCVCMCIYMCVGDYFRNRRKGVTLFWSLKRVFVWWSHSAALYTERDLHLLIVYKLLQVPGKLLPYIRKEALSLAKRTGDAYLVASGELVRDCLLLVGSFFIVGLQPL